MQEAIKRQCFVHSLHTVRADSPDSVLHFTHSCTASSQRALWK